jgi:hypothetical protein
MPRNDSEPRWQCQEIWKRSWLLRTALRQSNAAGGFGQRVRALGTIDAGHPARVLPWCIDQEQFVMLLVKESDVHSSAHVLVMNDTQEFLDVVEMLLEDEG